MEPGSKQALSPDYARAELLFDQFASAQTFKGIQGTFRLLCDSLRIKPTNFAEFYPKLKSKLKSWKAQALWLKFDKRAGHKCYNRGRACANTRVLIIGAGPCGLRTAIEAQLLGAKVVVIEKRDRLSRNNVLHLWPFVIHDLKSLGAKKFYGKFCAGAIDHISIRQLQCILLKVALLLGVEVHESVSFEDLIEPPADQSQEKIGWRALLNPRDHPVSNYEFDVLVGADGKRNTLKSFKRKEFRGKLAIAVTANFINRHSEEEARVQEISGVAFIFNQKFFTDLRDNTAIDLENIVYYKDETHYFVMTAKKYSLICKGVILNDYADTARLLAPENVNREALLEYAREAADFSTDYKLPALDFAVNHYGQPDVAMFDFTSMFAAESACRVVERNGHKLLQALVGDSLLEPFWPTGSGCGRGFLSSLDACWMIRNWSLGCMTPLQVLAERESIYRLLAQTNADNICKDYSEYTLIPSSRYPNLNVNAVRPTQVIGLFDTDGDIKDEPLEILPFPNKKRKRDSTIHPDTLLQWCQRQVILYPNVSVENMTISWKNGLALCAILHRYRPDLIDFESLKEDDAVQNCQLIFDIIEREFGIQPVMTASDLVNSTVPDALTLISYVSQLYDTFRGEIPHVGAPVMDMSPEEKPPSPVRKPASLRLFAVSRQRLSSRKRFSTERLDKESEKGYLFGLDVDRDKETEALRRNKKRRSLERDRARFILNKDIIQAPINSYKKTETTEEDRENFHLRVKHLEEMLYGSEKKPTQSPVKTVKVGKLDRGDWNVKMLEDRLKGNKSPVKKEREEVPKWSRDVFEDKRRAMNQKLNSDFPDEPAKYNDFDSRLKLLEKKLKEGNNLETGQRGMNKVSAMAEYLAATLEPKQEPLPLQRSNSQGSVVSIPNAEEICHICNKRVYFMEKYTAQGKIFHRGCFKCECCGVSLRLGNYGIGTEGLYSGKFLCTYHFNTRITPRKRPPLKELDSEAKKNARVVTPVANINIQPETPPRDILEVTDANAFKNRGITPERVEFENTLDLTSEEELLSEIDEDDWTERNFGNSASDYDSSDIESDFSSDDMSDADREELEEALQNNLTSDETIRLAENWRLRHKKNWMRDSKADSENEDGTDEEYEESSDEYSYEEYENEDDESTATEGEVQDGAGEGPSEHVISADELDKEGDVQITVPQQVDTIWKSNDYQTLNSNVETATEESDSKTSDSELYSGSDTETESGSHMDEDDPDAEQEKDIEMETDFGRNTVDASTRGQSKRSQKHFIPTIVIDEMTACPPNEDDDSYFVTLKEQSLKAEKTLENLIHDQFTESNIPTPETPIAEQFVGEEICPLVASGRRDSFELSVCKDSNEELQELRAKSVCDQVGTDSTPSVELPDVLANHETGSSSSAKDEVSAVIQAVTSEQQDCDNKLSSIEKLTTVAKTPPRSKPQRPLSFVEAEVKVEQAEKKFGSDTDVTTKVITGKEGVEFSKLDSASTSSSVDSRASQELSSSLPNLAKSKDKETNVSGGNRNAMADSPTAMRMLRLKERYLLGNATGGSAEVQSVSQEIPAKLEPVVKSFLEVISEKQKMLFQSPSSRAGSNDASPSSPSTVSSTPDTPRLPFGSSSWWSRSSPVTTSPLGSDSGSSNRLASETDISSLQSDKITNFSCISVVDNSEDRGRVISRTEEDVSTQTGSSGHSENARLLAGLVQTVNSNPTHDDAELAAICEVPQENVANEITNGGAISVVEPSIEPMVQNKSIPELDRNEPEEIEEGGICSKVASEIIQERESNILKSDNVMQDDYLDSHCREPAESLHSVCDSGVVTATEVISQLKAEPEPGSKNHHDLKSDSAKLDVVPSKDNNSNNENVDITCKDAALIGGATSAVEDTGAELLSGLQKCETGLVEMLESSRPSTELNHSNDSSNFSANSSFFENIDSRFITFRDKSAVDKTDLVNDFLFDESVCHDVLRSEKESAVDGQSLVKEQESSTNIRPVVDQNHTAEPTSTTDAPEKGRDIDVFDEDKAKTQSVDRNIIEISVPAVSENIPAPELTEPAAVANVQDESKLTDVQVEDRPQSQVTEKNVNKISVPAVCRVLSLGNENVKVTNLVSSLEDQDEMSKSDDDLMGMLSSCGSSDSDTTPSLDESIYTNPDGHGTPSSKFAKYVSRISEHSFPFGGVRDSIDVRRSAISRKSPSSSANLPGVKQDNGVAVKPCPRVAEECLPDARPTSSPAAPSPKATDEIPFADDESSQDSSERDSKTNESPDKKPLFKRPPLLRPLSMIETSPPSSSFLISMKNNALVDAPYRGTVEYATPKSVVEAVDDLRQLKSVEREKARQQARERARLKSDEELGLNNANYSNLRKRYQKADGSTVDIQEENRSVAMLSTASCEEPLTPPESAFSEEESPPKMQELPLQEVPCTAEVQEPLLQELPSAQKIQETVLQDVPSAPKVQDPAFSMAVEDSGKSSVASVDKSLEELERKSLEELERKSLEELERKSLEELERKSLEELERKSLEELERKSLEERERKSLEELQRKSPVSETLQPASRAPEEDSSDKKLECSTTVEVSKNAILASVDKALENLVSETSQPRPGPQEENSTNKKLEPAYIGTVEDSRKASLPSVDRPSEEIASDSSSSPDSEVFEAVSPSVCSPLEPETGPGWSTPESGDHGLNSESACSMTTSSFYEDNKKDDSLATSNSTSTPSKTDCASYLEPELSIEEVDFKICASSDVTGDDKAASSSPNVSSSGSVKAKGSSLHGIIMMRKDKSKNQKSSDSGPSEKIDKVKSKERKSLLSIFSGFGKSEYAKNKSKDKDEKEKKKEKSQSLTSELEASHPVSSPLEGAALKVDGTPKESRFPKLRLAKSKEKAKEKRKQKYLVDSQQIPASDSPPSKTVVHRSNDNVPVSKDDFIRQLESAPPTSSGSSPLAEVTVSPLHLSPGAGKKPAEITLDRTALIASMSSISKQIPSTGRLRNGVAPQASEDSFSDPEEDGSESKSQASSGSGKKTKDLLEERKRKYQKIAQRMYRQQEQKRLRMAQEIQRQLEELEVRQRALEARGVKVEKALRGEGEGVDAQKAETELMQEWFHLVHTKNVLVRQEQELMVKAKDLDLEDRHSRLQNQLQQRMAIDDSVKSAEEIEEESQILAEMLEIVEQRDTLIALLEENRQRHQEEDKDLELNMLAKGLFFQPPS